MAFKMQTKGTAVGHVDGILGGDLVQPIKLQVESNNVGGNRGRLGRCCCRHGFVAVRYIRSTSSKGCGEYTHGTSKGRHYFCSRGFGIDL